MLEEQKLNLFVGGKHDGLTEAITIAVDCVCVTLLKL